MSCNTVYIGEPVLHGAVKLASQQLFKISVFRAFGAYAYLILIMMIFNDYTLC